MYVSPMWQRITFRAGVASYAASYVPVL